MNYDLDMVKRSFFNMAVADLYRAIRGKSLMGAFTQSMCVIDAMAYLENILPDKGNRENYEAWVEEWIKNPLNKNCIPEVLYALRCGLVHTYGFSDRMDAVKMKGYRYTHNNPHLHWKQQFPGYYILNLDSHIAEITVAANNFFEYLKILNYRDPSVVEPIIERAKKLICIFTLKVEIDKNGNQKILQEIQAPNYFGKMDSVLDCLDDKRKPNKKDIAEAIRKIYKKE